jgi:hypothetical protein
MVCGGFETWGTLFNPLLYRLSYLAIWNFTTKTVKKRNYSKNADFYRVLGVNLADSSVTR